jgi:hypothetical protein
MASGSTSWVKKLEPGWRVKRAGCKTKVNDSEIAELTLLPPPLSVVPPAHNSTRDLEAHPNSFSFRVARALQAPYP